MRRFLKGLAIGILLYPTLLFGEEKFLTIIHTNDLHSHLLGLSPNIDYTPLRTGDDQTRGGWARVAAVIKSEKAKRTNPTLVLDAGDFLMGSLFHMVAREEALELRLMKEMGYDVVTLGNHEFDLMPRGLARILNSAHQKGGMPQIVFSNPIFHPGSSEDDTLEESFKKGMLKPYIIKEIQGIRIGIFGILGKDAAEVSPFARPMKFRDPVETSREMVKILREKEKADWVICLSHGGLRENKSRSEDDRLAKEVPGIDLIVGGHSHTKLEKPLIVNQTIIVQAGCHGEYVGVLDLAYETGKTKVKEYRLVTIDDTIKVDQEVQKRIESFIGLINERVLRQQNFGFYQVLAETEFDLRSVDDESNLGNLVADAIRWAINRIDSNKKDPMTKVVVAVESNGMIRDDLLRGRTGKVAVCDLFRMVPLGFSRGDDTMGYPLITCYFYAHEIKKLMEVVTSIYPRKGSNFFLQVSGVKFKYNPNRVIFDRVTEISLGTEEDGYKPLDYSGSNKDLYRVATTIYNATFISYVGHFTYSILDIVPKDRSGNPVVTKTPGANPFDLLLSLRVDTDKEKPGIQELKEWVALMDYVRDFPDKNHNGFPEIPEKYRGKLGRIIKEPSWNPVSLLSKGSYVTWIALGVVMGMILILGFGVLLFSRKIRKCSRLGMVGFLLVFLTFAAPCYPQGTEEERLVDQRVKKFLDKMKTRWSDSNVPEEDGKILYEIIFRNKYKRALEIGTSTGHSAIWIAWALSRSGGKLITIEIDKGRYRQGLANFKEAGLSEYINARLADAHELVKELSGPFDFVFIDADKDWYTNYAKALIPKLEPGGCMTAHNVEEGRFGMRGTREYYEYMKSLPEFETTLHPKSPAGMAISYKKRK